MELSQLILSAHSHIVSAHALEPMDMDAAFECERQAWDAAYEAGLQSATTTEFPELFVTSRTLTQAWTKARADRSLST